MEYATIGKQRLTFGLPASSESRPFSHLWWSRQAKYQTLFTDCLSQHESEDDDMQV